MEAEPASILPLLRPPPHPRIPQPLSRVGIPTESRHCSQTDIGLVLCVGPETGAEEGIWYPWLVCEHPLSREP